MIFVLLAKAITIKIWNFIIKIIELGLKKLLVKSGLLVLFEHLIIAIYVFINYWNSLSVNYIIGMEAKISVWAKVRAWAHARVLVRMKV